MRIRDFFPFLKDEGEVIASWGEAKLVRLTDGRLELKGGSQDDRAAAREWMSLFCHEAVAGEI
jgi:hypothetical protein